LCVRKCRDIRSATTSRCTIEQDWLTDTEAGSTSIDSNTTDSAIRRFAYNTVGTESTTTGRALGHQHQIIRCIVGAANIHRDLGDDR